jgi:NDP-sugar pyrophosphorylase family protein
MAISQNEWQNPYGIVKTNGSKITGFEEKPISRFNVNAGVYVLSPSALSFLEYKKNCDMPNLFERIRLEGLTTLAYPLHEQWLDVGRPEDFAKAVKFISI